MTPPKYRFARFAIVVLKFMAFIFFLIGALPLGTAILGAPDFFSSEDIPLSNALLVPGFFFATSLYAGVIYGFAQIGSAALDGAANSYKILERLDRLEGKDAASDTE